MTEPPPLRALPSRPDEDGRDRGSVEGGQPDRRASVLLGIALTIALLLVVWSRFQQGGRIDALEEEVRTLSAAVAERGRLIDAQKRRLDAIRDKTRELQALLSDPLPTGR